MMLLLLRSSVKQLCLWLFTLHAVKLHAVHVSKGGSRWVGATEQVELDFLLFAGIQHPCQMTVRLMLEVIQER